MEFENTQFTSNQNRLSMMEKYLSEYKNIFHNKKVLDIGCGTGDYNLLFKKMGVGQYTGIDISESSIQTAKEKYPDSILYLNDYLTQTFTQKFDIIFSESSMHYFNETLEVILNKVHLDLAASGYLIITHGKKSIVSIFVNFFRKLVEIAMNLLGQNAILALGKIIYRSGYNEEFLRDRLIYFKERPNLASEKKFKSLLIKSGFIEDSIVIQEIPRTSFIQVEHLLIIAQKKT